MFRYFEEAKKQQNLKNKLIQIESLLAEKEKLEKERIEKEQISKKIIKKKSK